MLSIKVTVAVILQVSNHLFRGALDPPWGLSLGTLVPAEDAEVASFSLDDAASVVVGERVVGVLRSWLWFCWVTV